MATPSPAIHPCPWLGSEMHRDTCYDSPNPSNVCFARHAPDSVSLAHQQQYCLTDSCIRCENYRQLEAEPRPAAAGAPRSADSQIQPVDWVKGSGVGLLALAVLWGLMWVLSAIMNPAPVPSVSQATVPSSIPEPSAMPTPATGPSNGQLLAADNPPFGVVVSPATSTAGPSTMSIASAMGAAGDERPASTAPPADSPMPPPSSSASSTLVSLPMAATTPDRPGPAPTASVSPFPIPTLALVPILLPAPRLTSPPDGANLPRVPVDLEWEASAALLADEWYDVQVWTGNEIPHGVAWSKEGRWSMPASFPSGTYQWRIVIIRGQEGTWMQNLSLPSEIRVLTRQ